MLSKFCRQDKSEPTGRLEEEGGVHREGGPRRGERRESDPACERRGSRSGAVLTGEVLVPNVGGVPDDRVERRLGMRGEEVPDVDARVEAPWLEGGPSCARARLVQLHSSQSSRFGLPELRKPFGGGQKEGSLAAGGLKDVIDRRPDGPLRHVVGKAPAG